MKAWTRSFVCFFVPTLLLTTQAWAVNLTGIWRSNEWGEIVVRQQDQNVIATYTGGFWGNLNLAGIYGFEVGDESFHGTLIDDQLIGKMSLHYPLSMKSVCPPSIWANYSDISFTVSPEGNTLIGQFNNEIRSRSTCNVIRTATTPVNFEKIANLKKKLKAKHGLLPH
jgi:hypothetical protein